MDSNVKISLTKLKPNYCIDVGNINNVRIYTPGEKVTDLQNFMRFVY